MSVNCSFAQHPGQLHVRAVPPVRVHDSDVRQRCAAAAGGSPILAAVPAGDQAGRDRRRARVHGVSAPTVIRKCAIA